MKRTWNRFSMIAAVVFTLCLAAALPSAASAETWDGYLEVEQFTDLVADIAIESDVAAVAGIEQVARLPESPGGVIAKVTSETKVTDHEKEVPPGGAAGVAGIGIRGPTTS